MMSQRHNLYDTWQHMIDYSIFLISKGLNQEHVITLEIEVG